MTKPKPPQADIGDPAQFSGVGPEDNECTDWDLKPLVFSSLNLLLSHVDLCDLQLRSTASDCRFSWHGSE